MTEADVIQPSASTASTGLGIRYIGQHCYAYSGEIFVSGAGVTTGLEFTSGAGYIVAEFTATSDEIGGAQIFVDVLMNGVNVYALTWDVSGGSTTMGGMFPIPIIIPPFTEIKTTQNTNTGDETFTHLLTGRVYGAE